MKSQWRTDEPLYSLQLAANSGEVQESLQYPMLAGRMRQRFSNNSENASDAVLVVLTGPVRLVHAWGFRRGFESQSL